MTDEAIRSLFQEIGLIQKGHFLRLSGRHTDTYIQCARLFEEPERARSVMAVLAERCKPFQADLVLSAAVGGILPGYEMSNALRLPNLYCEKRDSALTLRRGFDLRPGQRVLIVEDEVYTGQSVHEMMEIVKALGGLVVGIACLVDKSGGKLQFDKLPFEALVREKAESYTPAQCPMCRDGLSLDSLNRG